jgi:hypothetical protein
MTLGWKNNSLLFTVILLACFAVSAGVRYQQFETWKKSPANYFVGELPMMTTLDAPHFLRAAREFNEGTYGKNNLQTYPDNSEDFIESLIPIEFIDSIPFPSTSGNHEIQYTDVPLLSFLIAKFAPFFNDNYYLTGTMLIPVLASLFILPLGVYFFMIGVPVPGLLGGLIGTFASAYYMRSSIGRIDTDMLNLFFPMIISLFVLFAIRATTERNVLLFSVCSGLSLFVFHWWYAKGGFALAYFMVLIISLFVKRARFRTVLISSFLFVLCTQPSIFMSGTNSIQAFVSRYMVIENSASHAVIDEVAISATFPNTLLTISEVNNVSTDEVLRRIISNTTFGWIGFFGFFGFAIFRWRVLLPLFPILALGLFSFQSSNRFIMFMGPFIGIGLGWLLSLWIEVIFLFIANYYNQRIDKDGKGESKKVKGERLKVKGSIWSSFYSLVAGTHFESTRKETGNKVKGDNIKVKDERLNWKGSLWEGRGINWWNWSRQGVLYLGMGVFFWLISGQTSISFVPSPSIHTGLYGTFLEVKKRVPENSALLTWWDYGYAITDATRLATFHDGGSQFGPSTYFIARSLISPDQDELYDITQYLATEGNQGIIENNTSPEALLEAVRNPKQKPWDPIYLFFTADMTGKYGAISSLGSWDIVNGGSKPRGYQNLACNKITNEEMNCRGAKIDLKVGKINNQVGLKRVVFIRDGQVMREQKFGHTQGYTLQMLVSGNQIVEVQLIDEVVFQSNYNQMFLLGRYDEELFEETYNAFPFSRLYKVKF